MSKSIIEIDFGLIAIVVLAVFFAGEPDIHDAIIFFLMGATP